MTDPNITKITIDNVDVFLDERGPNAGKITISGVNNHNYSYHWGAMGNTLRHFIQSISSDYFANNLIGIKNREVMDVKKTFTSLRKHIKEEIKLPWYKSQDFQKNIRETLNEFQSYMNDYPDVHTFSHSFYDQFTNKLNYYLIEDDLDKELTEKEFKGISEPWSFTITKPSYEYVWLMDFHTKLKKSLK